MRVSAEKFEHLRITVPLRRYWWPRPLSVSLVRIDWTGNREVVGVFPAADHSVSRIARHWANQLRANWDVPAEESSAMFVGDPVFTHGRRGGCGHSPIG